MSLVQVFEVFDFSSDDGIEEVIQLYQLERICKEIEGDLFQMVQF